MKREKGSFTTIANTDLALIVAQADAKTALLLALAARRNYRTGGATLGQLIDALERPRRTFEVALAALEQANLVTRDGAVYRLKTEAASEAASEAALGAESEASIEAASEAASEAALGAESEASIEAASGQLSAKTDALEPVQHASFFPEVMEVMEVMEVIEEIEEKKETTPVAAPLVAVAKPKRVSKAAKPAAPTGQQELFGALKTALYPSLASLTAVTAGRVGKAATALAREGVAPSDVPALHAWVVRNEAWRDSLTAENLVSAVDAWRANPEKNPPPRRGPPPRPAPAGPYRDPTGDDLARRQAAADARRQRDLALLDGGN